MTYRSPKVFLPKQEPPLKFRHPRKSGFQRTRQDDAGRIPLVARSGKGQIASFRLRVQVGLDLGFQVEGFGVSGFRGLGCRGLGQGF